MHDGNWGKGGGAEDEGDTFEGLPGKRFGGAEMSEEGAPRVAVGKHVCAPFSK